MKRISSKSAGIFLGLTAIAAPLAAQEVLYENVDGLNELDIGVNTDDADIDPQTPDAVDPGAVNTNVAKPEERKEAALGVAVWSMDDAKALSAAVKNIGQFGLNPADYPIAALDTAIKSKDTNAINAASSKLFGAVIRDLRDGHTPMAQRVDWFIVDTDGDKLTTPKLQEIALSRHDIDGVFRAVQPKHADYWALLDAYNSTPVSNTARRQKLAVNIDRWRWLPRDLGNRFIYVNVPEYMAELVDGGEVIARHKVVVGATKTATPQLVANARGAIFNPKWYLPQSIVAEGIGATIRTNPDAARAKGYTWTEGPGGQLNVVQGAGPGNALGFVKLDMPNEHAIFLHDTPSKSKFDAEKRAFSHGCIRTHKALLFMGMLAVRYGGQTKESLQEIMMSGETTPVKFAQSFPVYILYFTATPDDKGNVRILEDVYGRDAPVVAALK